MASDDEFALKPCPCCGGHATMEHGAERSDNGWVVCLDCGLSTRYYTDPEEAANEWNRRAESVTESNHFGNAAATREALRALRDASRDFYNQILNSKYSEILDKYTCVKQGFPAVLDLRSAFPMANYALSAPPRNCDAMPWRKAWDEWRAKHHPQNPQTFNESYEATVAFMEWFTAPASEKGADDGE